MAGRKPDLSIKIKPADGGGTISLGAFWRENGRLSGRWDKRVKRVTVELEGGERVVVTNDGRSSHYLNVWEEKQQPMREPPSDDDVPF